MTTGRRPTLPPDELADTSCEDPPILEPFFDAPPGHPSAPQARDLHDRVSALEAALPSAATNALWIRRGVKVGAALLGLGSGVFAFALYTARAKGDADATIRERESERRWLVDTVRAHDRDLGEIRGELRARNPLGSIPIIGPPPEPKEPAP